MTLGGGLFLLLLPLATGWGLRRAVGLSAPAPAALAVPVLGVAGFGLWGLTLSLLGVEWNPLSLLVLPVLATATGLLLPAPPRGQRVRIGGWDAVALGAVVLSTVAVAAEAAGGWDFRYLWGLKARVFALAGGVDVDWLAWFHHNVHHPHYPPLWSVLIALGGTLGFDLSWTASVLTAGCLAALGATCWWAARRSPPAVRGLAALAGATAPGLAGPRYVGYAEPLLALLVAAGLAALAELPEAEGGGRRGLLVLLGTALLGMPLVKVEGTVLAAALLAGALVTVGPRLAAVLSLPAVAAAGSWLAVVRLHGIPAEPRRVALDHAIANLREIALWAPDGSGPWALVTVVVAACLLLALKSWRLGVVLALWLAAVVAAYLTTLQPAAWQVATSLDRVLSVPLPAVVAVLLGGCRDRRG